MDCSQIQIALKASNGKTKVIMAPDHVMEVVNVARGLQGVDNVEL